MNYSVFQISNFSRNGIVLNVLTARIGALATYVRENEEKYMFLSAETGNTHYGQLQWLYALGGRFNRQFKHHHCANLSPFLHPNL